MRRSRERRQRRASCSAPGTPTTEHSLDAYSCSLSRVSSSPAPRRRARCRRSSASPQDSVALALFASDSVEITAGLGGNLGADPAGATRDGGRDGPARRPSLPSRLCIVMPTIGGRSSRGAHPRRPAGGARPGRADPGWRRDRRRARSCDPAGTTRSRQFAGDRVTDGRDRHPAVLGRRSTSPSASRPAGAASGRVATSRRSAARMA